MPAVIKQRQEDTLDHGCANHSILALHVLYVWQEVNVVGGNYRLCGIIKGISGTMVEKNLEQTQLQDLLNQNSLEGSNIEGGGGDLWSVVLKVRTKVCTVAIKKKKTPVCQPS